MLRRTGNKRRLCEIKFTFVSTLTHTKKFKSSISFAQAYTKLVHFVFSDSSLLRLTSAVRHSKPRPANFMA